MMRVRGRVTAVLGALAMALTLAVAPAQAAPTADAPGWTWEVRGDGVRYVSPRGTFTVPNANGFVAEHARFGGGRGTLGYPTGPVRTQTWNNFVMGSQLAGRYQTFERGVIYSSELGTFAVKGGSSPFARVHAAQGGGDGSLGYPVEREVRQAPGYWYQVFALGVVYVSPRGSFAVPAEMPWNADYESTASRVHRGLGGGGGTLGYPTGNRTSQGGKHFQTFERGVVYCGGQQQYTTEQHCAAVTGGFLRVHAANGGGTGWLGYPIANQVYGDLSCGEGTGWRWIQVYANAVVLIDPRTGRVETPSVIGC